MTQKIFENHGKAALHFKDPTQLSGRYFSQKKDERNILIDIINKLKLTNENRCLDIGCGVGNILIPMSFLVDEIVGIDHPNCLNILKKRYNGQNIKLIGENFMDYQNTELFDKILVYSVIQSIPTMEDVFLFIEKIIQNLKSNGKALIGDIPNRSLKSRFLSSNKGKEFHKNWLKNRIEQQGYGDNDNEVNKQFVGNVSPIFYDDKKILKIIDFIREKGLSAYLLPQSPDLPFGNTREDILIIK